MKTVPFPTISRSVRQVYRRRLLAPVFYLLFLSVLWLVTPLEGLVFPPQVTGEIPLQELRISHSHYITTTLSDLHFTGYTQNMSGYTNGYYYYTFQNDQCILVLLAPDTCSQGRSYIRRQRIRARIIENFADYDTLTEQLAADLGWTASGIRRQMPDVLLSEPGFHKLLSLLLPACYFLSGAFACISIVIYALFIRFPILAPACRRLHLYGDANKLLEQAESELSNALRFAKEQLFLTQNFLIVLTDDVTAIVPVSEIIWIYKRSRLDKFLWRHRRISYTLHILANKRLHLQCKNQSESDAEAIVTALSDASTTILTGFNEKNRIQIQNMTGKHF